MGLDVWWDWMVVSCRVVGGGERGLPVSPYQMGWVRACALPIAQTQIFPSLPLPTYLGDHAPRDGPVRLELLHLPVVV